MRIYEIIRSDSDDFTGEIPLNTLRKKFKDVIDNEDYFKKMSGNNPYYFYIHKHQSESRNKETVRIMISDGFDIIGALIIFSENIKNVYKKKVYEVGSIMIDPAYRGRGISKYLYSMAMKLPPYGKDIILFAGDSQTPDGRRMWVNLYDRPNIEVTGWVCFYKDEINQKHDEFTFDEFLQFMENQGAVYFGESDSQIYFEYEVEKFPVKKELVIKGSRKPIKLYHGVTTGLMGRYIS
jgi:GNAT superfamily N-acetyltransferase